MGGVGDTTFARGRRDSTTREMKRSSVAKQASKPKGARPKTQVRRGEEHKQVPPKTGEEAECPNEVAGREAIP